RSYRSPEFLLLVDRLHDIISGSEMPDVAAPESSTVEPLPDVRAGDIVALLEHLDARGGREDVFRIAAETDQEYGHVIAAANAAELMDFVVTPRRVVVLEPLGIRFVRADATERKALWRQQLMKLALFRKIAEALRRQPEHKLDSDFVLETIVMSMPFENY